MKKGMISLVVLVALFSPAHLLAQESTVAKPKCIQTEREIPKVPKIEGFVAQLGGIANLEGIWKLGGMIGQFKNVVITFESATDGLKALINGLDKTKPKWGAIAVCDTIRADTLQVKVLKTQKSLYMRLGSSGSLELAQISDGKVGPFYSFVKN